MSVAATPYLLPGFTTVLPERGEVFYRHHVHPDPAAPTVLLVHGLTASVDTQFFAAYPQLAQRCHVIGVDHHGHGRGLRSRRPFELESVADDIAAVLESLNVGPVIPVGYSMGGPISLLLAHRHPQLVSGMVLQATALEWSSKLWERVGWKLGRASGTVQRSRWFAWLVRKYIYRLVPAGHPHAAYASWFVAELSRNDTATVMQAGDVLSRFDARSWAGTVGKPAGVLITTRDHLVPPSKQRALAAALGATVVTVDGDHLSAMVHPTEYAEATATLLDSVIGAVQASSLSTVAS